LFQNWAKEEGKHEGFDAQECSRHGKGRRNINESTHVKKSEVPVFQTGISDFYSYKMVNISRII
jgi:hypothetical protein